jgi:hypothetical protein
MTTDLIIKLPGEGESTFALTVLEIADDGGVMRGYQRAFPGPFRARELPRLAAEYHLWRKLPPDELAEVVRIRARRKEIA